MVFILNVSCAALWITFGSEYDISMKLLCLQEFHDWQTNSYLYISSTESCPQLSAFNFEMDVHP